MHDLCLTDLAAAMIAQRGQLAELLAVLAHQTHYLLLHEHAIRETDFDYKNEI